MEKAKHWITVVLSALLLLGLSLWCILKPADATSDSERRTLAAMPELSAKAVGSGKFMEDFADYATDQFPLRDQFRSLKAFTALRLFRNRDVNGIYQDRDGYLSKLEYPLDTASLDNAADKFRRIQEKYLQGEDVKVYFSVVPDKNYFMAEDCGALSLDYGQLTGYLRDKLPEMAYIDIFPQLSLEDYYKTDTHWRQERITGVARTLAEAMGAVLDEDYRMETLDVSFYGVYAGQSALGSEPETLYYLRSDILDACSVYDGETDSQISIYDPEKARGKDPYEIFLSGSKSLLKITNPAAETDRRLLVFRDSFGSSLAPLLVSGYAQVDVVDIRYLSSALLGNFLSFENCDVLFLYSTLVLNNSITLK